MTRDTQRALTRGARALLSTAASARAGANASSDATQARYVWHKLGIEAGTRAISQYGTGRREDAVALLAFAPRFALDVGCASGGVARALRDAYPQCRIWGIEPDAATAAAARTWVERVIESDFDAVDWAAEGVADGQIDTVFLLDVLEHMYNPWRALERLRRLVNPQAQLVISLPNARNMLLIRDLMNGYWRYRDVGLLDSTHIRFFTEHEALRLIYQTGFRVERRSESQCAALASVHAKMMAQPFPQRIEFEKGGLLIENADELRSFTAMQHMFLVRPARREDLSTDELVLIDAPHPHTYAMGSDAPDTL